MFSKDSYAIHTLCINQLSFNKLFAIHTFVMARIKVKMCIYVYISLTTHSSLHTERYVVKKFSTFLNWLFMWAHSSFTFSLYIPHTCTCMYHIHIYICVCFWDRSVLYIALRMPHLAAQVGHKAHRQPFTNNFTLTAATTTNAEWCI